MDTTTADITVKDVTGRFASANKVYDGNTDAAASGRVLVGAVDQDKVSLSGGAATFDNRNVGTAKVVTLTGAVLAGDDAGNYRLASVDTTTADITQRPLTVTADAKSKEYGSADPALTYQVTSGSLVAGESFTGALNRVAGEALGTYAIQQNMLSAGSNYALTYRGADLTIGKKTLTGSFTAANKVYDGTTAATVTGRTLTGVLPGESVTLDVSGAAFDTAAVGTGKTVTATLGLSGTHAGNYQVASQATTRADITAWTAKGFYAPVGEVNSFVVAPGGAVPTPNTATAWQTAKGGSAIPLKFEVFKGQVESTNVADVKSFSSVKLSSCSGTTSDLVDEFSTAGSSSLTYSDGQFVQVYKTGSVSGDTCYRTSVTMQDGTSIYTFVKLRK